MNKYLIIILLFNCISSQIIDNESLIRDRHDFTSRNTILNQINDYRDEDELLQFIESKMQTHLIPGLSISVVKDDNIVWEKQLGYANINNDIVVDENTMFILSSISKTITATSLMQLYEQGLFMLDDNINDYLSFDVIHPDYQNNSITFKFSTNPK